MSTFPVIEANPVTHTDAAQSCRPASPTQTLTHPTKGARMRTLLLTALLVTALPSFAQSNLMVDWEWKRAHQCSSTSPSIEVDDIPADAKSLTITLVDQDAPDFDHGGGVVAHDGRQQVLIPEGALKNYRGPCPPNFDSFGHDYQFIVRAIAADGKTELARGEKTKTFSANAVKQ